MKKSFIYAAVRFGGLAIFVLAVTSYFIYQSELTGWIIFLLGILCLASMPLFKISIKSVWPDIIFGLVDNGLLALLSIIGGTFAGVIGAIIGGVVGNAVTNGIAGIFEGYIAEKLRNWQINEERTMLGSAVGKMAGGLLIAGVLLVIASLLHIKF